MGAPGLGRRRQGRGRIGRQDGGRGRRAPSQGRPRRSRGDEFLSRSMPGGVVIVAAAAWLNALMGAGFLQVFGVYVVALQDAFGWQASALAGSFAVQRASTAIASPLVGAWLRRFGPRRVALAGVAAFALGTAILGSVRSLAALFAVMPLLGLATTAMGPVTQAPALERRGARGGGAAARRPRAPGGLGGRPAPPAAARPPERARGRGRPAEQRHDGEQGQGRRRGGAVVAGLAGDRDVGDAGAASSSRTGPPSVHAAGTPVSSAIAPTTRSADGIPSRR